MKDWRSPLHGSGEEQEDGVKSKELVVVNVHLHHMIAKKWVSEGSISLKNFRGELVDSIVEFGGRILAGDFNMALWQVMAELTARGLQVNLAAWYPWQAPGETVKRIDSFAMFMI